MRRLSRSANNLLRLRSRHLAGAAGWRQEQAEQSDGSTEHESPF